MEGADEKLPLLEKVPRIGIFSRRTKSRSQIDDIRAVSN